MEKVTLSIIVPVYNESNKVRQNTVRLVEYCRELDLLDAFEIILSDNGSSDNTFEVCEELSTKYSEVVALHDDKRGLGLGIRRGLEKAKYNYVKKQDIDIPFGLEVIKRGFTEKGDADVVIDSKGHPDSVIKRPFLRAFYSKILNVLFRVLYGMDVKDTQGSILLKKKDVDKFMDKLTSDTAFLQTQLVIYAIRNGLKIKEIPVKYVKKGKETGMRPIRDGLQMFFELIGERMKIMFSR